VAAPRFLVLHGPNLNLLGKRPREIYGSDDINAIDARIRSVAAELAVDVDILQTNHEGVLLDRLAQADGTYAGVVFNPGAFTHTSLALHDAVEAISVPVVEVHLSDILGRDEARRRSTLGGVVAGRICGFGVDSYLLALRHLVDLARRS
jgi:3-dehydroquinate dehydratase-2